MLAHFVARKQVFYGSSLTFREQAYWGNLGCCRDETAGFASLREEFDSPTVHQTSCEQRFDSSTVDSGRLVQW